MKRLNYLSLQLLLQQPEAERRRSYQGIYGETIKGH